MNIGKTIDELPSFTGTPSLGSYFAIRDMSLPNTDSGATKKFTISDFILLFKLVQNMYVIKVNLTAGDSSIIGFPITFTAVPGIGILRITDINGSPLLGVVDISAITESQCTAIATEDCELTIIVGLPI